MLALVAIVPSAPLLVPELAGSGAADTVAVRTAVLEAGRGLAAAATRWIAVGAADRPGPVGDASDYRCSGDFGAYGVPVPVRLGESDGGGLGGGVGAGDRSLPLSMLLAGWLRDAADGAATVTVTPIVVDPAATVDECHAIGARLAAEIAASPEPIGVLVVADGATALTAAAPGGGRRDSAVVLQERIDAALAGVDLASLDGLGEAECSAEGVGGRAAWQVLSALADGGGPLTSSVTYADAPFGVGYTVALWKPSR